MSLRRFDTAELAVLLRSAAAARPARSLALAAVTSTVASVALALFHRRRQKRLLLCGLTKEAIVGMRRRLFCAAQSVSYANTEPLLAVRGRGARLIDEEGREFLDTRNNVGHVGHSHPDVVAALHPELRSPPQLAPWPSPLPPRAPGYHQPVSAAVAYPLGEERTTQPTRCAHRHSSSHPSNQSEQPPVRGPLWLRWPHSLQETR